MTITRIAQVIEEAPGYVPGTSEWLKGHPCEGSKFHSPVPLLVRRHYLSDLMAMIDPGIVEPIQEEPLYLCSTCQDNLAVYLTVFYAYDGVIPKMVRRDFGNLIRDLGDRAWEYHLKRSAPDPV